LAAVSLVTWKELHHLLQSLHHPEELCEAPLDAAQHPEELSTIDSLDLLLEHSPQTLILDRQISKFSCYTVTSWKYVHG